MKGYECSRGEKEKKGFEYGKKEWKKEWEIRNNQPKKGRISLGNGRSVFKMYIRFKLFFMEVEHYSEQKFL